MLKLDEKRRQQIATLVHEIHIYPGMNFEAELESLCRLLKNKREVAFAVALFTIRVYRGK